MNHPNSKVRSGHRLAALQPAVRTLAALALVATTGLVGAGSAQAAPDTTVEETHRTLRIGDEANGFLLFVNKSRADLCTPERLVFEDALEDWFAGGQIGDPPQEPADSSEGVGVVTFTSRDVAGHLATTVSGADLPVEVWSFDNEEGGVDCTATDGPGAELVASGPMDWTGRITERDGRLTFVFGVAGIVTSPSGQRYNYEVRYSVQETEGKEPRFAPFVRWVPLG